MENTGYKDELRDLIEWYRSLPAWAKYALGPVVGVMVVGGIVSGASWALAQDIFSHLGTTVTTPTWIILIIVVAVMAIMVYLLWSRRRAVSRSGRRLGTERRVWLAVLGTDETLFRLLPKLIGASDRRQAAKTLLRELMRSGCAIFDGRVTRASLLTPWQRDYLKPWVTNMMPPESVKQMTFYIGRDGKRRRGVAGEAYVTGELRVAHLTREASTGSWTSDDPDYDRHNAPHAPGYRSFVAVPILSGQTTLGVMCFDSMDPAIFDSPDIQKILTSLTRRIAVALEVYQRLEQEGNAVGLNGASTVQLNGTQSPQAPTKPRNGRQRR